mgnify:CR=1 FL=1
MGTIAILLACQLVPSWGWRIHCLLYTSDAADDLHVVDFDDSRIITLIREHFDLRPKGLIAMLDLLRPIYQPTAAYGHFGREDLDLSWEKTDKAEALKDAAGI